MAQQGPPAVPHAHRPPGWEAPPFFQEASQHRGKGRGMYQRKVRGGGSGGEQGGKQGRDSWGIIFLLRGGAWNAGWLVG